MTLLHNPSSKCKGLFIICRQQGGGAGGEMKYTVNWYLKVSTLDDSHRTGTTEIVQAFKNVEENIEDSKEM